MNILASLAKAREADASPVDWEAVYAEQLPRVYNFLRYRVGDGAVAEDLTAVTFEKAWRARARYRSKNGAFSTWLLAIARRVAVDHFRRRRSVAPLEDAEGRGTSEEPMDVRVQRQSDFERLAGLLARLPARERELLALKYGGGVTNRAIAKLSGLSEG